VVIAKNLLKKKGGREKKMGRKKGIEELEIKTLKKQLKKG
jgi:hypothetical protein